MASHFFSSVLAAMPSVLRTRLLVLYLCAVASGAFAQKPAFAQVQYRFRKIVENPGNRAAYGPPAINSSGVVAYVSGGVLYKSNGEVTGKIAETGNRPGDFTTFGLYDLNDSGVIVFVASGIGSRGIYRAENQTITPIAGYLANVESPLGGPFSNLGPRPSINSAGTIAFMGQSAGGRGVFKWTNGVLSTVVDESGPLQEIASTSSAINDDGVVGFAASFDDRPSVKAVFTSTGGGQFRMIAGIETIGTVTASSLNDSGVLAFESPRFDHQPGNGIYAGDGGPLQTIAVRADELDDDPSINGDGLVAYDTSGTGSGLGIFVGPGGQKVIQNGDALFGSFVSDGILLNDLEFSSNGLNDAGQVAFSYHLVDGRQGVAIATPVPEPPAWRLFALALGVFVVVLRIHSPSKK